EQEQRGIRIREINGSFQFVTDIDNSDYIARLCTPVKVKRLSQSALEVLAIIAYRQPVTKVEIESIRGIRCDRVMEGLIAKGLVEDRGRSNAIGRPILYGTTDEFLRYFGLSSIRELPEIEDIEEALSSEEPKDEPKFQQISIEI
ncbi:MAG: SMC-Scp complex subunit ScpB, partial [Anaerovoracaceae bacterium]|nr:SMC-Scp complex subunit ScpB [Anaerovoracaceae bacterium]